MFKQHRVPLAITAFLSCTLIVSTLFFATEAGPSFAATKQPPNKPTGYLQKKSAPNKVTRPVQKKSTKLAPKAKKISSLIETPLTVTGIITATNEARKNNGGHVALVENKTLNLAAEMRMKDMFKKQYFEHNAPDGTKPAEVAEKAGYDYLLFGENIALGPFINDQAIVDAWMKSPLHRENMLKAGFTEIGIAVGKGNMFGDETWIGVQLFGKPAQDCPAPDSDLKKQIDTGSTQLDTQQSALEKLRAELDGARTVTNEDVDAYNEKVVIHNRMIDEIKAFATEINKVRKEFNAQVDTYNECLQRAQ